MGCWIEIADPALGRGVRFKAKDGVIVFPKEASGRKVSAQGTFEEIATSARARVARGARQVGREQRQAGASSPRPRRFVLGACHRRGPVLMADAAGRRCRPTCSRRRGRRPRPSACPPRGATSSSAAIRPSRSAATATLDRRVGLPEGAVARPRTRRPRRHRRTKANCLRICTGGPVAVVYPGGRVVWRLRSTRARTDHPGAPDRWASGRGVRDRGSAAGRLNANGERRTLNADADAEAEVRRAPSIRTSPGRRLDA